MQTNDTPVASYFSILPDLIVVQQPVPYDLFINSSGIEGRERFVRLFRAGGVLSSAEIQSFVSKYRRLYLAETQRAAFLKSLVQVSGASAAQKTTVLKDTAIHHLQTLFEHEVTTEVLGRAIKDCRDVVEGMIDVVEDYRVDQLQDLIGSLSFHDFYTYDHSINVSMYCILIYKALKPQAPRSEIVQAGLGGLLHDLGKIRIPTDILNSPDKLNEQQFAEIKKHPGYGFELLGQVKGSLPADIQAEVVGRVILEHHENFDGSGYPSKIAREQIHLLSRVTTIADFFDAITTKRSYHEPMSFSDALALMANSEGKKIDPQLFRHFVEDTQSLQIHQVLKTELAPDFDPCQPCRELPLVQHLAHATRLSGDGDDPKESLGKVKVADPIRPRQRESGSRVLHPKKNAG